MGGNSDPGCNPGGAKAIEWQPKIAPITINPAMTTRREGDKDMRGKTISFFAMILACLILTPFARAESRALIIGIGQAYGNAGITAINGPEKDVELIKVLASTMGFKSGEIKMVKEDMATKKAVLDGFRWVKDGVKNGGKAFIYYSGHGFQVSDKNGDEDDGCDEVLVPVDASSPEKFILDDEIGKQLKSMGKAETVIIIDSCFSGTITKGIYMWSNWNTKYLGKTASRCGKPVNVKSIGVAEEAAKGGNIVILTATSQNEVAYGDLTGRGKGSLLTQAIYDTVQKRGSNVTFRILRDVAAKRIRRICESKKLIPHTPQLYGDPGMFDKDIRLRPGSAPQGGGIEDVGANRELIERVVNSSRFMVAMRSDRRRIPIGDRISFSVTSSKRGYLNLVELEPNGNLNVIFPNGYVSDNRVRADVEKNIPEDIGGFKLVGQEPPGESRIVAIVTRIPLNLYTERNLGNRIGQFKAIGRNELMRIKSALTRSIAVKPEKMDGKEFGATGVTIRVVRR